MAQGMFRCDFDGIVGQSCIWELRPTRSVCDSVRGGSVSEACLREALVRQIDAGLPSEVLRRYSTEHRFVLLAAAGK